MALNGEIFGYKPKFDMLIFYFQTLPAYPPGISM